MRIVYENEGLDLSFSIENFQFSSVFQAWQMVAKLNNSLSNNHDSAGCLNIKLLK